MDMKRILGAALLAALLISANAFATSHGASALPDMNDGEIRRVDKDAKKITIRHGPLEKLEMPAMTMVFQVSDPAMLEQVKPGDKVRFQAEKIGGAFTVTKIEPAQ
jgi:Cu(I)/Ag(I) efflux system periplasmic protein CusF